MSISVPSWSPSRVGKEQDPPRAQLRPRPGPQPRSAWLIRGRLSTAVLAVLALLSALVVPLATPAAAATTSGLTVVGWAKAAKCRPS